VGEGWGAQARAGAVIVAGLLLALAATAGPLAPAGDAPGASLDVRLPDLVRTAVLVLLALSALLLLAVRPRPTAGDPLPSGPPRRRSAWTALLPFVVVAAAAWYVSSHSWSETDGHPLERAFSTIAGLLDLLARARKPPTSVPALDYTIAALVLLFALAVFALMVLMTVAERWWPGRAAAAPPPPAVGAEDLDDLRAEPDPRAAIVRAYGRFEHALAAARAPRAPWQTPTEFMRATLARHWVPASPVTRLTALFELARFSDRRLDPDARTAACDCLDEITTALETRREP
jgi:hypothetical protein